MADTPQFTDVFPRGAANNAYAQYFVGQSYLQPLVSQGAQIANVAFYAGWPQAWNDFNQLKAVLKEISDAEAS